LKKSHQLSFSDISLDWKRQTLPSNLVVIDTSLWDIPGIVKTMLEVPMDKSIILDFWVKHHPGDKEIMDEEHADLIRLQYMLNYRVRGRRFDFLGNSFLAKMVTKSLRERLWDVL
jgi:hypothetical protein